MLGADLYGRYLGGTFVQDGDRVFWDVADPEKAIVIADRVFWDVADPEKAIVIAVDNDEFTRLYIEVADPDQTVRSIEAALSER